MFEFVQFSEDHHFPAMNKLSDKLVVVKKLVKHNVLKNNILYGVLIAYGKEFLCVCFKCSSSCVHSSYIGWIYVTFNLCIIIEEQECGQCCCGSFLCSGWLLRIWYNSKLFMYYLDWNLPLLPASSWLQTPEQTDSDKPAPCDGRKESVEHLYL